MGEKSTPRPWRVEDAMVDAALDAWIARQFDWRASASRSEYRDDMRAALIAALSLAKDGTK
jgi:hypothetical protein